MKAFVYPEGDGREALINPRQVEWARCWENVSGTVFLGIRTRSGLNIDIPCGRAGPGWDRAANLLRKLQFAMEDQNA
jgi:hypothetical protein